ncbi:uncharacterized protein isoform X2 [Danio rerio]|uniref:Uncharacterized protein isoform X2 n=1 Tax=Danio rerio TaxID=7955 RepID=A0AC58GT74_DANRE
MSATKMWILNYSLAILLVLGASDGIANVHTYNPGSNGGYPGYSAAVKRGFDTGSYSSQAYYSGIPMTSGKTDSYTRNKFQGSYVDSVGNDLVYGSVKNAIGTLGYDTSQLSAKGSEMIGSPSVLMPFQQSSYSAPKSVQLTSQIPLQISNESVAKPGSQQSTGSGTMTQSSPLQLSQSSGQQILQPSFQSAVQANRWPFKLLREKLQQTESKTSGYRLVQNPTFSSSRLSKPKMESISQPSLQQILQYGSVPSNLAVTGNELVSQSVQTSGQTVNQPSSLQPPHVDISVVQPSSQLIQQAVDASVAKQLVQVSQSVAQSNDQQPAHGSYVFVAQPSGLTLLKPHKEKLQIGSNLPSKNSHFQTPSFTPLFPYSSQMPRKTSYQSELQQPPPASYQLVSRPDGQHEVQASYQSETPAAQTEHPKQTSYQSVGYPAIQEPAQDGYKSVFPFNGQQLVHTGYQSDTQTGSQHSDQTSYQSVGQPAIQEPAQDGFQSVSPFKGQQLVHASYQSETQTGSQHSDQTSYQSVGQPAIQEPAQDGYQSVSPFNGQQLVQSNYQLEAQPDFQHSAQTDYLSMSQSDVQQMVQASYQSETQNASPQPEQSSYQVMGQLPIQQPAQDGYQSVSQSSGQPLLQASYQSEAQLPIQQPAHDDHQSVSQSSGQQLVQASYQAEAQPAFQQTVGDGYQSVSLSSGPQPVHGSFVFVARPNALTLLKPQKIQQPAQASYQSVSQSNGQQLVQASYYSDTQSASQQSGKTSYQSVGQLAIQQPAQDSYQSVSPCNGPQMVHTSYQPEAHAVYQQPEQTTYQSEGQLLLQQQTQEGHQSVPHSNGQKLIESSYQSETQPASQHPEQTSYESLGELVIQQPTQEIHQSGSQSSGQQMVQTIYQSDPQSGFHQPAQANYQLVAQSSVLQPVQDGLSLPQAAHQHPAQLGYQIVSLPDGQQLLQGSYQSEAQFALHQPGQTSPQSVDQLAIQQPAQDGHQSVSHCNGQQLVQASYQSDTQSGFHQPAQGSHNLMAQPDVQQPAKIGLSVAQAALQQPAPVSDQSLSPSDGQNLGQASYQLESQHASLESEQSSYQSVGHMYIQQPAQEGHQSVPQTNGQQLVQISYQSESQPAFQHPTQANYESLSQSDGQQQIVKTSYQSETQPALQQPEQTSYQFVGQLAIQHPALEVYLPHSTGEHLLQTSSQSEVQPVLQQPTMVDSVAHPSNLVVESSYEYVDEQGGQAVFKPVHSHAEPLYQVGSKFYLCQEFSPIYKGRFQSPSRPSFSTPSLHAEPVVETYQPQEQFSSETISLAEYQMSPVPVQVVFQPPMLTNSLSLAQSSSFLGVPVQSSYQPQEQSSYETVLQPGLQTTSVLVPSIDQSTLSQAWKSPEVLNFEPVSQSVLPELPIPAQVDLQASKGQNAPEPVPRSRHSSRKLFKLLQKGKS